MIRPLIEGLVLTLKHAFSPAVTLEYPEQRWEPSPRYRGRHQLLTHGDGSIKCVACMLCKTVCPAQCIYIEGGLDDKGQQYPELYEIDLGRCIFCGFCVEACPKEAIFLGKEYEFSTDKREKLIYTKEDLLVPESRKASAERAD